MHRPAKLACDSRVAQPVEAVLFYIQHCVLAGVSCEIHGIADCRERGVRFGSKDRQSLGNA